MAGEIAEFSLPLALSASIYAVTSQWEKRR